MRPNKSPLKIEVGLFEFFTLKKVRIGVRKSFYEYCVEQERQELLSQWHPTKNGDLTPETTTSQSTQKIW